VPKSLQTIRRRSGEPCQGVLNQIAEIEVAEQTQHIDDLVDIAENAIDESDDLQFHQKPLLKPSIGVHFRTMGQAGSLVRPAIVTYRPNVEMIVPANCVPAVARMPTSLYNSGASMNQPPKIVVRTAGGRLTSSLARSSWTLRPVKTSPRSPLEVILPVNAGEVLVTTGIMAPPRQPKTHTTADASRNVDTVSFDTA